jgi:hypothetical protein
MPPPLDCIAPARFYALPFESDARAMLRIAAVIALRTRTNEGRAISSPGDAVSRSA